MLHSLRTMPFTEKIASQAFDLMPYPIISIVFQMYEVNPLEQWKESFKGRPVY